MPTYVVECYWPGITTEQAEQALATIGYCRGEGSTPTRVHPLGCILVPSDGMAFFLIIGPSEARIREAGEVIELPFDRIVESVPIVLRNELAVRRRSESVVVSRVASGKTGFRQARHQRASGNWPGYHRAGRDTDHYLRGGPMSRSLIGASLAALVALAALALAVAVPARASASVGFAFHASNITGISTGSAFLTGGGAFHPEAATAHAGGGFRCTNTIAQVPFAGCEVGQGVRWDTSELLPSTMFKCTAAESPRAISTDEHTLVLSADFYRAGDGTDESFTAQMIVSASDLDRDLPGDQHVWIQGIGCGSASVSFGTWWPD